MIAIGIALAMLRGQEVDEIWDRRIVVCDLAQVPIRAALEELCKDAGVKLSVDPEVEGTATLLMRNSRFEQVLQNILMQVDCTYELAQGTVLVHRNLYRRIALAEPTYAFRLNCGSFPSALHTFQEAMLSKVGRFCEVRGPDTKESAKFDFERAYFFDPLRKNEGRLSKEPSYVPEGLDLRFPEAQLARYIKSGVSNSMFAVLQYRGSAAVRSAQTTSSGSPGLSGPVWLSPPVVELFVYEIQVAPSGRLKLIKRSERTAQQAWQALDEGGWIKRSQLKSLSPVLVR